MTGYAGLPLGLGFQETTFAGGLGRDWKVHDKTTYGTVPPGISTIMIFSAFGPPAPQRFLAPLGVDTGFKTYLGPIPYKDDKASKFLADSLLPVGMDVHIGYVGLRFVFYPVQFVDFLLGFFGVDLDPEKPKPPKKPQPPKKPEK